MSFVSISQAKTPKHSANNYNKILTQAVFAWLIPAIPNPSDLLELARRFDFHHIPCHCICKEIGFQIMQ